MKLQVSPLTVVCILRIPLDASPGTLTVPFAYHFMRNELCDCRTEQTPEEPNKGA